MRAKVLDEKVSGSPNLSSKKLETQKKASAATEKEEVCKSSSAFSVKGKV